MQPDRAHAAGMNSNPDEGPKDAEEARRKLIGRAMLIGFLVLVAVYAVFTFLGRR